MKKSLLAVVAALAIAGCSQTEIDGIDNGSITKKVEIGFNSYVGKAPRATDFTTTQLLKFTVFSYVTNGNFTISDALPAAYMNGVVYTKENSTWKTDDANKYYWPVIAEQDQQNVQFFGYPNDMTATVPATGYPYFLATDGEDIVVAHAKNMTSASEGVDVSGALTLNFKHILTKINFSYKPEDANLEYEIAEIKISGIKTGGDKVQYSFNDSNGAWDLSSLTVAATPTEYNVTQATEVTENKDYYSLGAANASLMLYPQNLTGASISVKYSTSTKAAPIMKVYEGTKTVELSGAWEVGKSINYILTLPAGGKAATITPVIDSWTESDSPQTAK